MNVVKCVNGHFFDFDKYETCPHCGAPSASENASVRRRKHVHKDTDGDAGISSVPGRKASAPLQKEEPPYNKSSDADTTTASITMGDFMSDVMEEKDTDLTDPEIDIVEYLKLEDSEDSSKEQDPSDNNDFAGDDVFSSGTLRRELQSASASNEQRTLGYYNRLHGNGQEAQAPVDPVTGWLVCIKGPHFGESFSIVSGNNAIGRGEGNRIVLNRDRGISNHRHAQIIYEPKKRKFYLQPGDSSGLTYLEDTFITSICELKPGAVIELGSTRLLFVPLCGDNFSWEEYF